MSECFVDGVSKGCWGIAPHPTFVKALRDDTRVVLGIDGHRAVFALAGRSGSIDQDMKEPRLDARSTFESIESAKDAQPGVLDDVFGGRFGVDVVARDAHEGRLVARHELSKRTFVALA